MPKDSIKNLNVLFIEELSIKGSRVLMRVDFNVPLGGKGEVVDDTRIRSSLTSIKYVLDHGGSLVLMSHLGRPKGKKKQELSLAPCAERLSRLIDRPVKLAPDCVGKEVSDMAQRLRPGEVLMLENLRFRPGEEHPEEDPEFAEELSNLGDVYVNDAFGCAHRSHSSIDAVARRFPYKAAAGYLLKKEIDYLGNTLLSPKRPFCALIGGAKISSKIGALKTLVKIADVLLIGGAMAYTFLKAQGIPVGASLCEDDYIDTARDILKCSQEKKREILLPEDIVIADAFRSDARTAVVQKYNGLPDGWQGMDIGPKTIELYIDKLKAARTIFWNGPLGVFEMPRFAKGTQSIANALARTEATTIVGGGDSAAALKGSDGLKGIDHISTGGGASLEFIEKGTLPGIESLTPRI